MNVLDRVAMLDQLRAFLVGQQSVVSLARWAFDQFYAEAEGKVSYEAGYRSILAQTLDDLMFGDDPHFQIARTEVEHMVQQLETAMYREDSDIDDELEDEPDVDVDDE
ncbi:MAG: hypothetical protein H0X37_13420 [Herpetosiphonaceae bacterium]|nr:hypothetical protein [Herpetosiphonaceae bacterium]